MEDKNKKQKSKFWRIVLLLIILVLLVWYFNSKKNNQVKAPIVNEPVKQEKLIVEGKGNEPGWYIKLYGTEAYAKEVKAEIVLDYGDTSWAGQLGLTYQASYVDNFQYRGDILQIVNNQISSTSKNIIVYFEKGECYDPAGNIHNYKVNLNFNAEKSYDGCADLLP